MLNLFAQLLWTRAVLRWVEVLMLLLILFKECFDVLAEFSSESAASVRFASHDLLFGAPTIVLGLSRHCTMLPSHSASTDVV
jgi:hypothetical protein